MDIPKAQQQPLITLEEKYASRITVVETVVGKAIQATEPIAKGTHLYPFAGKILNAPNMHTVQLDATRHILCVGGPEFTAHSCDPNAYFMFVGDAVTLVAIKDIRRGELISFNYCTTEWDMAEKFPCACKAEHCFGWIKGMKHCDAKQRDIIMAYASPYIRSKILAEAPVAALPTPAVATLQVQLPSSPARDAKEHSSHSASPTKGTATPPPAASGSGSNESTPPRTPSPSARTLKPAPSLSAAVTSNALSALSAEIRSRIEIVESSAGIGKAIQTTTFIPKGTALYPCMGTISSEPDMWTVQLDAKRHIMCLGGPAYTAHSCDPNAYFQFVGDSMTLVAIKDIQPLELVTFNYCTTEWHMSAPFDCVCKSPNCLGAVRGYSHVTEQKLRDIMTPYLSPYIRAKALEAGLITPAAAASIVFVPPTPAATSPVVPREAMAADAKHPHSPSHSPVPFGAADGAADKDVAGALATLSVSAGATVPPNLYGATAESYRNALVTNNAGRAVVQGAAPVAGHTD